VSTDNIRLLISSLTLCWGNVSNSEATMKFAQLYYFYHKILGGTKDIMPPLLKRWGGKVPSPHKLGPCIYVFTDGRSFRPTSARSEVSCWQQQLGCEWKTSRLWGRCSRIL